MIVGVGLDGNGLFQLHQINERNKEVVFESFKKKKKKKILILNKKIYVFIITLSFLKN